MRGWSELTLLVGVVVACWTRTPVGTLGEAAWAVARGTETPDLLARFSTELSPGMQQSLGKAVAAAPPPPAAPPPSGLPGPQWSAPVRAAISAHLGAEALTELDGRLSRGALPAHDAEAALEIWALGTTVRDRAVHRARASGEANPERYAAHRRYLSEAARNDADRAVAEVLALATALDLTWPVEPGVRVTSPFGYRHHPVLSKRKLHEGVDLAVPIGTPVLAAGSGKVSRTGKGGPSGVHAILDHGHGVTTNYCHANALHVTKGEAVDQGQHVLDSGNTGRSTGPHLHFGLRIDGRAVDPAFFQDRAPDAPAT